MRFENDKFLIVIERKKKEVTEASENTAPQKGKKKWLIGGGIAAAVLAVAVFVAIRVFSPDKTDIAAVIPEEEKVVDVAEVDETEEVIPEGVYVTSEYLLASVNEKYEGNTLYGYDYGEPYENIARDYVFEFPIEYNPEDLDIEYWTELYGLYQDPELTKQVSSAWEYDAESGSIKMSPGSYTVGKVGISFVSTDIVNLYPHSSSWFFDTDAGTDWGNVGTLYLEQRFDAKTGEILEKPIVSIVTIKGEIEEKPDVRFSITDDGRVVLSWDEVEGAERYFIGTISLHTETGKMNGNLFVSGETTDTTWISEAPDYGSYFVNSSFKAFRMSEDDWLDQSYADMMMESHADELVEGEAWADEFTGNSVIAVIAMNQDGTSMLSNIFYVRDIAANLPYSLAYNSASENDIFKRVETIQELPVYADVIMCDGKTVQKLIEYKIDEASVKLVHYINIDSETEEYIGSEDIPVIQIPYVIEGTPFEDVATIEDYTASPEELEKALQELKERQDGLRKKGGSLEFTSKKRQLKEIEKEVERTEEVRQIEDIQVTANSALSEYLALNMLGSVQIIDISAFPECSDSNALEDAWMEAYYQNPLILGTSGYQYVNRGKAIQVFYDDDAGVTAKKQAEIVAKVKEIVAEIITDDMTDLEKELAINQYLCDTIEYDMGALENAEKNNFRYVDESFNDSFTAYGALLNRECVCAGYAAAFKLLTQEAGLDSIVVTGNLEGGLSHAWNKVKIDGDWQIIDATNNDNEYLFNALLNLPDSAGERVLVEDKRFVLDKVISNYRSDAMDNEYYRINDKYYTTKEIAGELIKGLETNGEVTLRTDYELNDNKFYRITDEIFAAMGNDIRLYGYYWMGVIYLAIEE